MVATCLQVVGFVTSFVGWIGIIVTTSTNDWVVTCGYTIPTCRKLDELGSKGLWADCVMATGLYHCKPLVDILILPGKDPCLARGCPPNPILWADWELSGEGGAARPNIWRAYSLRGLFGHLESHLAVVEVGSGDPNLSAPALLFGIWEDRGGHWPSRPGKLTT